MGLSEWLSKIRDQEKPANLSEDLGYYMVGSNPEREGNNIFLKASSTNGRTTTFYFDSESAQAVSTALSQLSDDPESNVSALLTSGEFNGDWEYDSEKRKWEDKDAE